MVVVMNNTEWISNGAGAFQMSYDSWPPDSKPVPVPENTPAVRLASIM